MSKIVRTPTRAEGGLTDAEREQLKVHTAGWIANTMSTDPCDPDIVVPAVKRLYAVAGLKEPRVVIAPSPLVVAMAGGFAAGVWYLRKHTAPDAATDDALYAALYAATRAATYAATRAATDDATYAATRAATRAALYAATRAATDAAARDATGAATDAALYAATRDATYLSIAEQFAPGNAVFLLRCTEEWGRMHQGGNMWSAYDCYLTAARDVLGLRLRAHTKYEPWETLARNSGFRVVHPEFCIVSDRPEILKVDDQNRPHCEDGPSHRWRDGWSLYHWHGVRIPDEWITDKASLTAKTALTWENIEQRRAACEIVGWARILDELDAKTIDKDEDPHVGELLEVTIPDIGKERFIRVQCGTGRIFAIPVPPDMQTALQANAWTYDIPADIVRNLEVRT